MFYDPNQTLLENKKRKSFLDFVRPNRSVILFHLDSDSGSCRCGSVLRVVVRILIFFRFRHVVIVVVVVEKEKKCCL